jgi:glycine/D-amino acid oxidase-like deaminating enzyme
MSIGFFDLFLKMPDFSRFYSVRSFWEKDLLSRIDFLIVGAGITGLSAACSLQERMPKAGILLIDKDILPKGASTRNAGFGCFGSLSELDDSLQTLGADALFLLVNRRWKGLQKLIKRVGPISMQWQATGGFELITNDLAHTLELMPAINELLEPIFHQAVFSIAANSFTDSLPYDRKAFETVISNPFEGVLHPALALQTLERKFVQQGGLLLKGMELTAFEEVGQGIHAQVKSMDGIDLDVEAHQIILCTNAWVSKLLPEQAVKPGRGLVLLSKPMAHMPYHGAFHIQRGFYYFRHLENRLLIGGGRHLDKTGETTLDHGINPLIWQGLERQVHYLFPENPPEIDMAWTGIMGFREDKMPQVQQITPNVFVLAGLSGMGIALASSLGEELVDLLGGKG